MNKLAKFPYHIRTRCIVVASNVKNPQIEQFLRNHQDMTLEQMSIVRSLLVYLDRGTKLDAFFVAEVVNTRNEVSFAASACTPDAAKDLLFNIIPQPMISMIGKN